MLEHGLFYDPSRCPDHSAGLDSDTAEDDAVTCGSEFIASVLYTFFMLTCSLVLFNLFIAIILENFNLKTIGTKKNASQFRDECMKLDPYVFI